VFSFFDCPFEFDPEAAGGPGLAVSRALMRAACAPPTGSEPHTGCEPPSGGAPPTGSEPSADFELRRRAAVEFLLSHFLREPRAATAERYRAVERFAPATAFIRDQLGRRIKIAEAAALTGMHPTYFANEFHRAFGMPPRRYILTKRIELAQRLLWTTDQPLKAVAATCGLDEPAYFCRVFRRITGVSPGAYRDLARRQRVAAAVREP
jgi:AraC-like DNA-binding protein